MPLDLDREQVIHRTETAAGVAVTLAAFLIGARLELFERFAAWIEAHEGWQADEAVIGIVVGTVCAVMIDRRRERLREHRSGRSPSPLQVGDHAVRIAAQDARERLAITISAKDAISPPRTTAPARQGPLPTGRMRCSTCRTRFKWASTGTSTWPMKMGGPTGRTG